MTATTMSAKPPGARLLSGALLRHDQPFGVTETIRDPGRGPTMNFDSSRNRMQRRNFLKVAALAAPAITALVPGRESHAIAADRTPPPQRDDCRAGRKYLFIDERHVERRENLSRRSHQPKKVDRPVLEITAPHEGSRIFLWNAPYWDEAAALWKMHYLGGHSLKPRYATSSDGYEWEKPALELVSDAAAAPNNIVNLGFDARGETSRFVFVRTPWAEVPFRALTRIRGRLVPLISSDGLNWERQDPAGLRSGDEYRLGYDAYQDRYLATVKFGKWSITGYRGEYPVPEYGRSVGLSLSDDFENWTRPELICPVDEVDQEQGRARVAAAAEAGGPIFVNHPAEHRTEIYNMQLFTYEGVYLGLPTIFNISGTVPSGRGGALENGILYPQLASSRDLVHWERPGDREPFIPLSAADSDQIDRGMLFATTPVKKNGLLWCYYNGHMHGHASRLRYVPEGGAVVEEETEPTSAVFLAHLREDGFVSFHAGEQAGVLLTKVLTVDGSRLCVNADAARGEIRAEIRDAATGLAIPGFSLGDYYPRRFCTVERHRFAEHIAATPDTSVPITTEGLDLEVRWKDGSDLSALKGREVRIQFLLRDADLYSFWFAETS